MSAEVARLPREFVFDNKGKKIILKDPDPTMSVDAVRKHYAGIYPEMVNVSCSQPEPLKTKVKYTFSYSAPRTKG